MHVDDLHVSADDLPSFQADRGEHLIIQPDTLVFYVDDTKIVKGAIGP